MRKVLFKGKTYRVHRGGYVEVRYIRPDEYGGLMHWRVLPKGGKRAAEVLKVVADFDALIAKEVE